MWINQHNISRRRLLQQGGQIAATALFPTLAHAQSRRLEQVGLQLYTLRKEMSADLAGTLGRVAELGYREMEFAGYFEHGAAEIRQLLDDNGLISPAAHVPLEAIRNNLQAELDFAAELGQRYLVLPFVPENERSADHYKRHAETLNTAGEAARRVGLKMGYHNHAFEFEGSGDQLHYDVLLAETDPQLVDFELDLFWISKAQVDPLQYFVRHPGRFSLLHVKDMDTLGRMVDVGRGSIDFAGIFAQVETAGFRHYFVEHDNPVDGLASVADSIAALRRLRF